MSFSIQDILTGVAIISLLTVVIGDRVMGWLKTRGVDLTKMGELYELAYNTHQNTSTLLDRLDDGVLEKAIENLSENVVLQTDLLRELLAQAKLNHEEHKLILDQMVRDHKR